MGWLHRRGKSFSVLQLLTPFKQSQATRLKIDSKIYFHDATYIRQVTSKTSILHRVLVRPKETGMGCISDKSTYRGVGISDRDIS
ncbi:hypothetical protein B0H17DRAFT_1038567 [Mycena rosella]|uniref:Uncharacterized protein n=1 Tax=Mycena rosella TaxID=1033263 RepID=A0AAD7M7L6_MYCRO|nr:hypothetical protein B0H17DRAFT_1038567 [Mycena rosella]